MDASWLKRKLTVEEAEAGHMIKNERLGPEPVPFGFCNRDWRELLAKMQEGDELWEYSSSAESWEHLCGRAGIVLMRNGEVVAGVLTAVN